MNIIHQSYSSGFWFRINGYGLKVVDRDLCKPLFSVRNGHTKEWRIFKYGIQFLTPKK